MIERRPRYELPAPEVAMRVLKRVERDHSQPHWSITLGAQAACIDFGLSRATAFRHVRTALDVLGVHYKRADRRNHWESL